MKSEEVGGVRVPPHMEVSMYSGTENLMNGLILKCGRLIVEELSRKYGFELDEGLKHLNLEENKVEIYREKKSQLKIALPFCGVKYDGNCEAIRLNHGMYTQCPNEGIEYVEGRSMCKTCLKQTKKNTNGKPTYGYIDERVELGEKFRDPKGKEPVLYGNIMEKLNITREDAEKEAMKTWSDNSRRTI